jgi:shikimate kinase
VTAPAARSSTGPRHVVLVGLMGSGKTTVGKKVALLLGRRFLDADVELEARSGRSVAAWFEHDGEDGFRAAEARLLADLLAETDPLVVGAGGGVVVTGENRARLSGADTVVVYLHADPAFLATRARAKPEVLADMYAARDGWYREVADAVVEVRPAHEEGAKPKWRLAELVVEAVAPFGIEAEPTAPVTGGGAS